MTSMTLNQILNVASSVESKLTDLSANDATVGQKFSDTELNTAKEFKGTLDTAMANADAQRDTDHTLSIAGDVISAVSAATGLAGASCGGRVSSTMVTYIQRVHMAAQNVADPLVSSISSFKKIDYTKQQGANTEEQVECANELKTAGGIAGDSVGLASDLINDRSGVAGNVLQAIKGENSASN